MKGQGGRWASGQTQECQLSCREKRKTCSLLRPQQEQSGNEGFSLPLALSPGLLSSQCPEPNSLKPREHQVPCLPPKYLNYLSLAGLLSYLAAKWLLLKEAETVVVPRGCLGFVYVPNLNFNQLEAHIHPVPRFWKGTEKNKEIKENKPDFISSRKENMQPSVVT